jgi:hypothetical protein
MIFGNADELIATTARRREARRRHKEKIKKRY